MKTRLRERHVSMGRMLLVMALAALAAGTLGSAIAATQIDIVGPAGSGAFGTSVKVLPNGNIVVTDPGYDAGATQDVGAVYLYDGKTGAQISMLTGSTAGDKLGSGSLSVVVLSNGNYLLSSRYWDNGAEVDAGAVTWASGTAGVSGVVSAANSLVGSTTGDQVGYVAPSVYGVTELSNGNYVVSSPTWDNGGAVDAGAVTWGSGTTGVSGAVSAANSLVGSSSSDQVGSGYINFGMPTLANGNYVVASPNWHSVGAATWGNGTTGAVGEVSAANSLVGSTAGDQVAYRLEILGNGNYVVCSPFWDNGPVVDVGASTWVNGAAGTSGVVSAANSLVGSTAGDKIGYAGNNGMYGTTALNNNGNYVVNSPLWDNGGAVDAGAVTWGNGATGISGAVSPANSLVGSTAQDGVGSVAASVSGVTALRNGNYVVRSAQWDNGAVVDAGAATWGNGTTGITGPVSAANSLVGSATGDKIGYAGYSGDYGLTALNNGNYLINSPLWNNGGTVDAGAVTWGNGTTGATGVVSPANSLVGSTAGDQIGSGSASWRSDYNFYVVSSPLWDNGGIVDAGAATWGNATTGTTGAVSAANSLVGSTADDKVGEKVAPLKNGNYVVNSSLWDNGAAVDAGAVTWGNGTTGTSGAVSAANSLVGSTAGDKVGSSFLTALSNGNYVATSPYWDNAGIVDAGAATWGNGATSTTGPVSAANSLVGSTANDRVGSSAALSDDYYVVQSSAWDNGEAVDAGAMTLGIGTGGTFGPITADNSVRGTAAGGGSSMSRAYDGVNHQLVVGRPKDNIVTLFRPSAVPPEYNTFLPIVLRNAP